MTKLEVILLLRDKLKTWPNNKDHLPPGVCCIAFSSLDMTPTVLTIINSGYGVSREEFDSIVIDTPAPRPTRPHRPSFDEYYINMVKVVSTRGSCARRAVGCILVNKDNQVLSTGYNGPARGLPNCTDEPCAGANCKSGEGLELCEAIHAEQNALLQCPNVEKIHTAYCSCSPCIHCVKLLLNTGCQRIVFIEEYPHPRSKWLWENRGEWIKFGDKNE